MGKRARAPEGSCEVVQPADGAVRRKEVEYRRPQRFAGENGQRQHGERREAGEAREEPEREVVHVDKANEGGERLLLAPGQETCVIVTRGSAVARTPACSVIC